MEQEVLCVTGRKKLNKGSAFCGSCALIAGPQMARDPVRLKEAEQEEAGMRGGRKNLERGKVFCGSCALSTGLQKARDSVRLG